jgi:hypothetical protein
MMKPLKFNLIFLPLLAVCLGGVCYIARELLLENARFQVIENARIIMETALSSRTYTTKQVAPLLQQKNLQTANGDRRTPEDTRGVAENRRRQRAQGRARKCSPRFFAGAATGD